MSHLTTKMDLAVRVIEALRGLTDKLSKEENEALDLLMNKTARTSSALANRKCAACRGLVHEGYMVTNEVWSSVMTSREGHLHLQCLERLLGRPLMIDDFTDVPINHQIFFGYRLSVQPPVKLKHLSARELAAALSEDVEKEIIEAIKENVAQDIDRDVLKGVEPLAAMAETDTNKPARKSRKKIKTKPAKKGTRR